MSHDFDRSCLDTLMWPLTLVVILAVACVIGLSQCRGTAVQAHSKEDIMDSMRKDLYDDLVIAEGREEKVYWDVTGHLTGGIGHRLNRADMHQYEHGAPLSDVQIEAWFDADYKRTVASAEKHFERFWDFPHLVKLAILNWIWQLGEGAPEEFPHATRYLNERKWTAASFEWLYADLRTLRRTKWWHQTPHRCEIEVYRLQHADKHQLHSLEDDVKVKKPGHAHHHGER